MNPERRGRRSQVREGLSGVVTRSRRKTRPGPRGPERRINTKRGPCELPDTLES